jgi:uncharacterized membrane protein YgdD (TMEM256/DUF423 family)
MAAGAVLAGLGVAAGAFGAHGLEGRVDAELVEVFGTGARYQIIHALALLVIGLARARTGDASGPTAEKAIWLDRAAWMFVIGVALFCGSLYGMTLTGARWLGAVTPLGGLAFLSGWVCLTFAALSSRR